MKKELEKLFGFNKNNDEPNWLSVSDLMSGLMVFLFILIAFADKVKKDVRNYKEYKKIKPSYTTI